MMVPSFSSMAAARRCGSIYKGFAQCLLALGDSLSVSSQKDEDMHDIDSVCRSVDHNITLRHIHSAVMFSSPNEKI